MNWSATQRTAIEAVRDALRADDVGLCARHIADSLDRALLQHLPPMCHWDNGNGDALACGLGGEASSTALAGVDCAECLNVAEQALASARAEVADLTERLNRVLVERDEMRSQIDSNDDPAIQSAMNGLLREMKQEPDYSAGLIVAYSATQIIRRLRAERDNYKADCEAANQAVRALEDERDEWRARLAAAADYVATLDPIEAYRKREISRLGGDRWEAFLIGWISEKLREWLCPPIVCPADPPHPKSDICFQCPEWEDAKRKAASSGAVGA